MTLKQVEMSAYGVWVASTSCFLVFVMVKEDRCCLLTTTRQTFYPITVTDDTRTTLSTSMETLHRAPRVFFLFSLSFFSTWITHDIKLTKKRHFNFTHIVPIYCTRNLQCKPGQASWTTKLLYTCEQVTFILLWNIHHTLVFHTFCSFSFRLDLMKLTALHFNLLSLVLVWLCRSLCYCCFKLIFTATCTWSRTSIDLTIDTSLALSRVINASSYFCLISPPLLSNYHAGNFIFFPHR